MRKKTEGVGVRIVSNCLKMRVMEDALFMKYTKNPI